MPASLRPLRHRDYALVWSAGFVSNTGSWMQTVAVGAYVASQTGQAAWAGLAAVAAFLPQGILSPIGGALADRLDRRRFLIVASVLEAAVAATLALLVVRDQATPGLVTAIVLVGGCLVAMRLPFNQALLPDLVEREDLLAAASLSSAQWNLGRVIGPTLAAGAIALWGYEWAFMFNAGSFLAVIVAMALVRVRHDPKPADGHIWRRIAEGRAGGARRAGLSRRHPPHVAQRVPRRPVHRAHSGAGARAHGRHSGSRRPRHRHPHDFAGHRRRDRVLPRGRARPPLQPTGDCSCSTWSPHRSR